MSAISLLSVLAYGQLALTDDANTLSAYPTKNFGNSIALIVGSGASIYLKLANLGSGINGNKIATTSVVLYGDVVLASSIAEVYQVNGAWSEGSYLEEAAGIGHPDSEC